MFFWFTLVFIAFLTLALLIAVGLGLLAITMGLASHQRRPVDRSHWGPIRHRREPELAWLDREWEFR